MVITGVVKRRGVIASSLSIVRVNGGGWRDASKTECVFKSRHINHKAQPINKYRARARTALKTRRSIALIDCSIGISRGLQLLRLSKPGFLLPKDQWHASQGDDITGEEYTLLDALIIDKGPASRIEIEDNIAAFDHP